MIKLRCISRCKLQPARDKKIQKDREKDKKTEKKTKRHNMEGVLLHYLIYKTKKNNGTVRKSN